MTQQPPDNSVLSSLLGRGASMRQGQSTIDHGAFQDALVSSRLLVPIHGTQQMPGGDISQMNFVILNRDGVRSLLAFTDDSAARMYFGDSGPSYYLMDGRELCHIAVRTGMDAIVLNAAGPVGYSMPRHEFTPLAEGLRHQGGGALEVPGGPSIQIGPYRIMPIGEDELRQLRSAMQRAQVTEAYWTWAKVGGGEPHIALGVPTDQIEAVYQILGAQWSGREVYVLPLNDAGVGEDIRRKGQALV